ncbi:hypothetical protein CRE_13032 [Caenorhabditis remanei]|uniref:Transposase Tc1-like domain-containing protein n=1 Tax=Caenorhabditis remanei TaxID=31234 RepID=E3N7E0_CAERE|nr:hypothetical protein CRE_13032 [Caenorhabditis remanei]
MTRPTNNKNFPLSVKTAIFRGHLNGQSTKMLAAQFQCSPSGIRKLIKRCLDQNTFELAKHPARPRKTSHVMDRNIIRASREDPRMTSTDIQVVVTSPNEPVPSKKNIRKRLQAQGLHGRRQSKTRSSVKIIAETVLSGQKLTRAGDLLSGHNTFGHTNPHFN